MYTRGSHWCHSFITHLTISPSAERPHLWVENRHTRTTHIYLGLFFFFFSIQALQAGWMGWLDILVSVTPLSTLRCDLHDEVIPGDPSVSPLAVGRQTLPGIYYSQVVSSLGSPASLDEQEPEMPRLILSALLPTILVNKCLRTLTYLCLVLPTITYLLTFQAKQQASI